MKYIRKSILNTTALLLCLVCLCACKSNGGGANAPAATAAPLASSTATPLDGGTLRIPMTLHPQTLHPLFIKESSMRNIFSMIFEPFVELNEAREPSPCIAQSWTLQNNVWTFEIRPGVRWHNNLGEVSASDVAFSLNTVLVNPDSPYYAGITPFVEKIEVIGSSQLQITVKKTGYAFIFALCIPVIPQAYYQDKDKTTMASPCGSGSFFVETASFAPSASSMQLASNDKWWKKKPILDKVVATGFADTETAIDAFLNDKLDCVHTSLLTTDIFKTVSGVSAEDYISQYYNFLAFNFSNKLLAKLETRQAIAYTLDRTQIISNIYLNKATGVEQPFFIDSSLACASVMKYDHNITKARALLNNAGIVDTNGDGCVEFNGEKAQFRLLVINTPEDPVRSEAANAISAQLAEIGIEIQVTLLAEKDLKEAIDKKDYDLLLSGYYLSNVPLLSFALATNGSGNLSNYSDSAMNNALNQMEQAKTLQDLQAAAITVQTRFAQTLPHIGLFFERSTLLYKSTLIVSGSEREMSVYKKINSWYYEKSGG